MGRIFGYVRVAPRWEQSLRRQAVRQSARLDCICQDMGQRMSTLFVDVNVESRVPFHLRIQGARLARIMEPGDIVLVTRLSRLGRGIASLAALESWFEDRGVGVVTPGGVWIVATPVDQWAPPPFLPAPPRPKKGRRPRQKSSTGN